MLAPKADKVIALRPQTWALSGGWTLAPHGRSQLNRSWVNGTKQSALRICTWMSAEKPPNRAVFLYQESAKW